MSEFISIPTLSGVLTPLFVLLFTVFGAGLINTPFSPYISIALSLKYLDRPWDRSFIIPLLYLFASITVGTGVAYAGMLQTDKWDNSLMEFPFLMGLLIGFFNILVLWIHLVWQRRFIKQDRFQIGAKALLGTLVAPALWVSVYKILYSLSPTGTYGSIAYSQFQIEPVVQWSSVAGISGIEFLVVWSAIIIHRVWTRYSRSESENFESRSHIRTEGLFWNGTGAFYMKPLTDTIQPTVTAGCVIGNDGDNTVGLYVNQTIELAKKGSEIVIWSEGSTNVKDEDSLNALLSQARNITTTYGIYLGVSYMQYYDNSTGRNMFTLLDPTGQVVMDYQKGYPVPLIEIGIIPGPRIIPTVDTKFGRLAAAICFDLDFPGYIAQAGKQKTTLFLQPSWTWGSIGRLETSMLSFRAVEQGFSVFRCSSWSPSAVWDPYHQIFGYKYNLGGGTFMAEIPIRDHVSTIYTAVGDLWAYICCAFSILNSGPNPEEFWKSFIKK
ncbi:hypothetical protein BGZ76_003661 [Entomortierella beljakovae]|nr:hypothetical protein BGZ76_003661 [Entomortierella beljakovae]